MPTDKIGLRVRLEYADHGESFAVLLPRRKIDKAYVMQDPAKALAALKNLADKLEISHPAPQPHYGKGWRRP